MSQLFSLAGKTALITGASGGIGRALVEGFLDAGASVAAADLESTGASDRSARAGERLLALGFDVTSRGEARQAIERVREAFGGIDVLVNNAGIKSVEPLLSGDRSTIARTLEINAEAVLELSRAVFDACLKDGGGRIINVGSSISSKGSVFNYQAGGADYCYSKAMVHNLTRLIAHEAAAHGVTVNTLAPGIIHTPMHGRPESETEARHRGRIPLGRIGLPEDLVGAAVFLASDSASYITGQVLHVNGGMVMAD